MKDYEKEILKSHFDYIWKYTNEAKAIPIKPMNQYTVDDIVTLMTRYDLIRAELEEMVEAFELKEDIND